MSMFSDDVIDKAVSSHSKDLHGMKKKETNIRDVELSSSIEVSGVNIPINDSKLEQEKSSSSQSMLAAACITMMMSVVVMISMGVIIFLLMHLINRKQASQI